MNTVIEVTIMLLFIIGILLGVAYVIYDEDAVNSARNQQRGCIVQLGSGECL